jgi:hypothetical protein
MQMPGGGWKALAMRSVTGRQVGVYRAKTVKAVDGFTYWADCGTGDRIAAMADSLEGALISVWRQALVDGVKEVEVAGDTWPVRETARRRLKQVDFRFEGHDIRGLEQNPDTKSRWAALARKGQKVMQFLEGHRYFAVVADGRFIPYAPKKS